MELETWSGDWGLPSIDINCLQVMVYCKIVGAPLTTKAKNNPFRRSLPTFRHGKTTFSTLEDVTAFLQRKHFNTDHTLSSKHISEVHAYNHLLKDKLYPALQFIWWIDEKNYVKVTRPWYANKLPFPFNFYYPGHYQKCAKDLIESLYGSLEYDYSTIETQVYSDAEKCLTLLSNKLGESKYFFGNQPTSLDAIIFSYLAPLLKAPFANAALQNHLKACTNLVNYVDMILKKYYSAETIEYEMKRKEIQKAQANDTFPNNVKHQIIAVLIVIISMFGYMRIAPTIIGKDIYTEGIIYETEEECD